MEQTAAFEDDRLKLALARSVTGDAQAFAELVREHQGMVFSIAYHFLQDRSLAEDLAQEVFLELYQSLDRIQSPAHLVYWLRRVTANRCIDHGRKKHRRRELDPRTARRLLRDFSRIRIEYHASERWTEMALDLAIRHGVTVYDGLYLALATGSGCRLVTADRRLHEACRKGPLRHLVDWVREIP